MAGNPWDNDPTVDEVPPAAQRQREAFTRAADATPDQAGEAARLGERYGLPGQIVLRSLPELKKRAEVDDNVTVLQGAPKLAAMIEEDGGVNLAAEQTKDDLPTLAKIEKLVGNTTRYLMGANGNNGVYGDLAAGARDANAGVAGAYRAALEQVAPAIDLVLPGAPTQGLADRYGRLAAQEKAAANELSSGIYGVSSGVRSLTANVLNIPIAFVNPALALGMMSAQTGGSAYTEGRDQGLNPVKALMYGASQGVIEYATEKLPLTTLLKDLDAAAPMMKVIINQIAKEAPGEQIATLLQDLNDWAVLPANANKTFADYISARPSAALETLIATAIGVGGNVAVGEATSQVAERLFGRERKLDTAAEETQRLTDLFNAAGQSLLRKRNPQTFAEFAQRAASDNPDAPGEVYIDAQALVGEGGVFNQEELAQILPSVTDQVAEALLSGGDVTLPIGELLANVAGTPKEKALLEHLRTTRDGYSAAEAEQVIAEREALVQSETEKAVASTTDVVAAQASRDAVKNEVLTQLNAAKRFTPEANDAYASLAATFYTTMGARVGMTAEQLYAANPLLTRSQVDPGNVLNDSPREFNQGARTEPPLQQITDKTGGKYNVTVSQEVFGASNTKPNSVLVQLNDPLTGERRGFVDFSVREDGVLTSENSKVAGPFQGKGLAEAMYKAARNAGYDIAPGRVQTDQGLGLVQRLQAKGVINKEAAGPRYRAGDLQLQPIAGEGFNQGARGTFNPSTLAITLNETADLSTFLHETGHFFLEMMGRMAAAPNAPADVVNDMAAILKWFGIKKTDDGKTPLQVWQGMTLDEQREYHEKFAESFEQYLFSGKAPSVDLQPLFSKFKSWLVSVYKSLREFRLGQPRASLNKEITEVMNRMLASEEQIRVMEEVRAYEPLFKSAKEAGMTELEFQAYLEQGRQATDTAIENLQTRSLRDMQWGSRARARVLRKLQADQAKKRKAVEEEVRAEVEESPIELARAYIKSLRRATPESVEAVNEWKKDRATEEEKQAENVKAELLAANPEVNGIEKGQLVARNKREMANEVERRVLAWEKQNRRPQYDLPQADMEAIAQQFGYTSADELRRDMVEQPPAKEVIEGIADQRMLERYGDLTTQAGLEAAADAAVHNELRTKFVASELKALQDGATQRQATGEMTKGKPPRSKTVNVLVEAAKQFADAFVARQKVRALQVGKHTAAETRAGKNAEKALRAGDTALAIASKRDQLLQGLMARRTNDAVDEIAKGVEYLKKLQKSTTISRDYLDQIDALLERVDLKARSNTELNKRASLAEWVKAQEEQGISPELPDYLMSDIQLTSYRDMTVEQFRGLVDAAKQIEHLGRLKHKLLTIKDQREYDAIVTELVESIRDNGGKVRELQLEPAKGLGKTLRGVWADHRKLNSLIRQMDGGKDNGPFYRAMIRAMNEAGAREDTMIEQATEKLAAIYKPVLALKGGVDGDVRYIPEIKNSLSRGGRLSIALNWGNTQNRQRVMSGDGWTEEQVDAILKTLTPVELKFVNDIWGHIDGYWPEIKAKQLRVLGVVEEKVAAEPFELNGVAMRGGYYPIKYDVERSLIAEKQEKQNTAMETLRGAIARATTRRGHTKARVEEVQGRPIRKDLSVITQHVNQVVHDLAWHEWFIDANRLMNDSRVQSAIRDHYGNDTRRVMQETVNDIATGDNVAQTSLDRILLGLRNNISRSVMGLSLTTALLQPFGLTQSMARIGAANVIKGAARWAGDAAKMESSMSWIQGKSEFMRLRAKSFNRELREISSRVQGKSKAMQIVDGSLFFLMQKMQMIADVPTWIGQYEKSLAQGHDEATAIALADEAVLGSQGGGTVKDTSPIQRNHPFLTQFYSYFNTTLNLVLEKTGNTNFKNPVAVMGWAADMALLTIIPAILPALIVHLLKGGGDDEDPEYWAKKLAEWQANYLFGMVVGARELPTVWSPFDYSGPPAGRILNDIKRVVQQAEQGELDAKLMAAVGNLVGSAAGLPTVQVIRSIKGWDAWANGDAPPSSILMGPPPKD